MIVSKPKAPRAPRRPKITGPDWDGTAGIVRAALDRYAATLPGVPAPATVDREAPGFQFRLENLPFPDGIGAGTLDVEAYTWRGDVYLRAQLAHNRRFLGATGPGGHLFLNDYLFNRPFRGGDWPEAGACDERAERRIAQAIRDALKGLDEARFAFERMSKRVAAEGATVFNRPRAMAAESTP